MSSSRTVSKRTSGCFGELDFNTSMSFSSGTTSAASLPSSEPSVPARLGNLIFRARDVLFPIVLLALAFGTRPRIAGGSERVDHLVDVAGVLVSLTGQLLRVMVIGLVYIKIGRAH